MKKDIEWEKIEKKEKKVAKKIDDHLQVKSVINLGLLKKTVEDKYRFLNSVVLTPFPYKGVIPSHFVVSGKGKEKWFLKIREMSKQNIEMLETLYNLLEKKNFSTLFPLKNIQGKYITTVYKLMLYVSPYIDTRKTEPSRNLNKEIDLFSTFCNITNLSRALKKKINRRKFEINVEDFNYVMSAAGHVRSLTNFFGDISGLEKSVRNYFENYECRWVCHGDCSGHNFLNRKGKWMLIDFDDVGLGDLKFEIFRVAHDGTRNFRGDPVKKFFGNIERINCRLKPDLRFSRKDFAKLEIFLFLYNTLRLRYRHEKGIFSKKYADFCNALRKYG